MAQDVDYEQEAREFLHRTAAQVHADPDLYNRVRSGAARRRRTRSAMVTLTTTAMIGVACWGGVTVASHVGTAVNHPAQPTQSSASTIARSFSCPRTMPDPGRLPSNHSGMNTSLVPGQPQSALACAYTKTWRSGDQSPTTQLTGTVPVAGTRLTTVVSALREPISPYPLSCPFAPVSQELFLAFGYADGSQVDVEITFACPYLTNGVLSGSPSSNLGLPSVVTVLAAPAS